MKDYYAILDVPPTASQEAIREQYLLLIQAWHPDKFSTPAQKAKAEEKCKEINVAYGVLRDGRKRARYDRDLSGRSSRSGAEEQGPRRPAHEAQRQHARAPRPEEPAEENQARAAYTPPPWEQEEWVRIYFEQARRRQSGQPPAGLKHHSRDPIRVLIVDDLADSPLQIRGLLAGEVDIRVVGEASNALAAIRQFDALMPDVTVTAINMPNLDGCAVTEGIRRRHPTAKVIILSVQSSAGDIRRAAMAGACDYLTRPTAAGDLQLAVRLAAGRAFSNPEKSVPK